MDNAHGKYRKANSCCASYHGCLHIAEVEGNNCNGPACVLTEKGLSYVVDYVTGDLFFLPKSQLIRLLLWRAPGPTRGPDVSAALASTSLFSQIFGSRHTSHE